MIDYPGSVAALPYREHVRYLASDLIGTRALYDYLLDRLNQRPRLRDYYDHLCAPLTPLLVEMTERGMLADPRFIREETGRLDDLAAGLAQQHLETLRSPDRRQRVRRAVVMGDAEASRPAGEIQAAGRSLGPLP